MERYLFAATAFWGISVGLLVVTVPFRFQQLGLPILQYGVTLAAYAAGMLVTEALWGVVAFRLGRPAPIIGVGMVVGGATVLLAFAKSFPMFLIAEILLGAMGVYLAPLLRWVALTMRGPGSEGSGTGRWSGVFGVGIAIGVTAGPTGFVVVGFTAVALVSAGVLAVGVWLAAMLPWRLTAMPAVSPRRSIDPAGLTSRPFLLALGLVLIAFTANTFTTNFLPYYSLVLFGGTPSEAGYVLGAARIVSLAAAFGLGTVVDRWGSSRAISLGFALLVLGGGMTWLSRSYDEMVLATLMFSAGLGWLSASLLPLALATVPRDHQGTAIGVFGSVEDAGFLVGPLMFGAVWSAYGPTAIFPVVTALASTGVGVALLAIPRTGRASEAAPAGPQSSAVRGPH